MRIADFHSDVLTSPDGRDKDFKENEVVKAIFRGDRTFQEVLPLAEKDELIAFEDVGYEDLDFDKIARFSPVYVGLTWNGENKFGYGCNFSDGLKKEGKSLIKFLNKSGIAVDTAHISKGGFKDIIENAETVVNSHTCFNGAYSHKRNLDDWQIELLIEKNAPIGVTLCGYFMSDNTCRVADFIRQIDYFAERFGTDNLCIGTDFYGCDYFPEGINDYEDFSRISEELEKLGYKKEDIEKIFYGNLNSFLEKRNGKRL